MLKLWIVYSSDISSQLAPSPCVLALHRIMSNANNITMKEVCLSEFISDHVYPRTGHLKLYKFILELQ